MAEASFDVSTLGEPLVRLSVPGGHRLETATHLDLYPGGAECNVVSALARLGRRCAAVTALPANALGRLVAAHLRLAGVDLTGVVWCETGRIGTYYVEPALPPQPTQVIYDRAGSCFSQLTADQVPWDILMRARLVHLTGITPALSPTCRALVAETIRRARAAGIAISFDINYRQKLWPETEATAVLTPLIQGVDLLLCSRNDARRLFGCSGTPEQIVTRMAEQSSARQVVVTFGAGGAVAWDGREWHHQPAVPVQIVDRMGAGDALAAGVIHGWLNGDLAQGLRYGVTLAAMALTQYGDAVVTTQAEVERALAEDGGDVLR